MILKSKDMKTLKIKEKNIKIRSYILELLEKTDSNIVDN